MKHATFKNVRRTYRGIGAQYRSLEAKTDIVLLAPNKRALARAWVELLKAEVDFKRCLKIKMSEDKR